MPASARARAAETPATPPPITPTDALAERMTLKARRAHGAAGRWSGKWRSATERCIAADARQQLLPRAMGHRSAHRSGAVREHSCGVLFWQVGNSPPQTRP
eukprot:2958106-Prymnesium_polylepis.1